MKYTFLVPAYKAKYFEEALGSILRQTYADFNVIVSDDCSPEDLKSIVDKFDDPRVTYRRNEKNIGAEHLVDHWNLLLGLTNAEYIIMASDDDIYAPEYLEEMDRLVRAHPDMSVFRPLVKIINGDGSERWREQVHFSEEVISLRQLLLVVAQENYISGLPQYIFHKGSLIELGGFIHMPLAWFSDDLTVAELAKHGIPIVQKTLFSFRISGISISSRKPADKVDWYGKIYSSSQYVEKIKQLIIPEDKELLEKIYNRIQKMTIKMISDSSFTTYCCMMKYIKKLHSPLFPLGWRIRRYIGRPYHKIIEQLKKKHV